MEKTKNNKEHIAYASNISKGNLNLIGIKTIKNCSSEPAWRLVRTSNPGGVKAPGVRFAL